MLLAAAAAAFYVFSGVGTAASATVQEPNPDCTLIVPANPLCANGLATPYQLTATDPGRARATRPTTAQSAFVEATILDPATGALSVYHPLVVNKGAATGSGAGGAETARECGGRASGSGSTATI